MDATRTLHAAFRPSSSGASSNFFHPRLIWTYSINMCANTRIGQELHALRGCRLYVLSTVLALLQALQGVAPTPPLRNARMGFARAQFMPGHSSRHRNTCQIHDRLTLRHIFILYIRDGEPRSMSCLTWHRQQTQ